MTQTKFSVLGIPIDCVGRPGGTELSPQALRQAGLLDLIPATDLGDLPVRIDNPARDPVSGIVGFESVYQTTQTIRQAVYDILARGERPFLLGGCCTQLMGAMAAAHDFFGRIGLAYADGHIDLYDGQTSPTGEAADVPLSVILGYGPEGLQEAVGLGAPALARDVVLVGYRDLEEAARDGSRLPADLGPEFVHYDVQTVRHLDPAQVGQEMLDQLLAGPQRYWLHLDVDILDQQVFPATDYLMPNGLDWNELVELLKPVGRSANLVGVAVACYNPEKDPEGVQAKRLIEGLAAILG